MLITRLIYQVRLTWRLLQDSRIPIWKKVLPFLGLVYVFSPIDLIPDWLLGPGQMDDIGMLWLSMRLFERSVPPEIIEEHRAVLDGKIKDGMMITTDDYTVKSNGGKRKR